jgi:hypothetical protein
MRAALISTARSTAAGQRAAVPLPKAEWAWGLLSGESQGE